MGMEGGEFKQTSSVKDDETSVRTMRRNLTEGIPLVILAGESQA